MDDNKHRVWKVAVIPHRFRLVACSSASKIHTWRAVAHGTATNDTAPDLSVFRQLDD
jgi:hypothetical protein